MSINNPFNPLKKTSTTTPDEIYSTDERRIGTWIDGKPLYRKTIECLLNNNIAGWRVIQESAGLNIETLISSKGVVFAKDGTQQAIVPNSAAILNYNKEYQCMVYSSDSQNILDVPAIITIEYTKTTD